MVVRFRLEDHEREAIANGADILITELTFGGRFSPIKIEVAKPNEIPGS
jgi:hypothetical protein